MSAAQAGLQEAYGCRTIEECELQNAGAAYSTVAVVRQRLSDLRPLAVVGQEAALSFVWSSAGLASQGQPYWSRTYRLTVAGQPVRGARLYLIDVNNNKVIDEQETDENGYATFSMAVSEDDVGRHKYAVSLAPYYNPLDPFFTDTFELVVYLNKMYLSRNDQYPDCYARFFGRTINVDPVTYDKENPIPWLFNPAFVLGVIWPGTWVYDLVPVLSGMTIEAYYDDASPHWWWNISSTVTDNKSTWSYSTVDGHTCPGQDYVHPLAAICVPQVPDEYIRLLKVTYTTSGVQMEQWKRELRHTCG